MNAHSSASDAAVGSGNRKLWLICALLLALVGLGLSAYATWHHRTLKAEGVTSAACNINQTVNCDSVAASPYSEVMGIPLGVWGGAYFLALVFLLGTALTKSRSATENLHGYSLLVGIGFLVSVVLGGISVFKIGAACLTCMGVYGVTTIAGLLLIVFRNEIPGAFSTKTIASGLSTGTIVVAAVICAYVLFAPKITSKTANSEPIKNADGKVVTLLPKGNDIPIAKSAYAGLGEDYRKGNDQAKVVVVEFADFQCPACARVSAMIKQLAAETGDRALFVFKNYPLDSNCNSSMQNRMHEQACNLAVLARCAGQYGKFWEYHDMAFAEQNNIKAGSPENIAKVVGLTDPQIEACKKSQDILAKVKEDIAIGNQVGVDATPTIFINGRKFVGDRTLEGLKAEIDALAQ